MISQATSSPEPSNIASVVRVRWIPPKWHCEMPSRAKIPAQQAIDARQSLEAALPDAA